MTATGFSIGEAARLSGMSARQVPAYVHASTKSTPGLSFQDVLILRTAKDLLKANIAPQRITRALKRLQQQLPDRPLSSLSIRAEGNRIVAKDGDVIWEPESGQLLMTAERLPNPR